MFKYDKYITNSLIITKYINKTYQLKKKCLLLTARGAFLLGESGTCFTSLFQKTKSWFVALKNGMFQNYVSGNQKPSIPNFI